MTMSRTCTAVMNHNNDIPNKNKLAGPWKLDSIQEFHLL